MIKNKKQDKGQVIAIAILIMLLMFISVVSMINLIQVPKEEAETEMKHFDAVQRDFDKLDNSIFKTAFQGSSDQLSIQLGTRYEGGFIMDSPFPRLNSLTPRGEIQIEPLGEYQLRPASGGLNIDPNINNTEPEIDNINFNTNFQTSKISYEIQYSQIQDFRKTIEPTIHYNTIGLNNITQRQPDIINGKSINIPLISGGLRTSSSGSSVVKVNPVSSSSNPVTVSNLDELHIPTDVPKHPAWLELADEPNVNGVDQSNNDKVILDLDPNVDYSLEIAEVRVLGEGVIFNPPEPEVQYISMTPDQVYYEANESRNVTARVVAFDAYHNRASGVEGRFQPNLDPSTGGSGAGSWNPRETVTNQEGFTKSTWKLRKGEVGENGTHEFNWGS